VANAVLALSAHGFEEGGIPSGVYLSAYALALLLVFGLIALKATSHFGKETIGPPSVR